MQIDYKGIGFKCGLEIHQRLATSTKLFCSCPNVSPSDREIARVERQQRAVAGELGSTDRSSKFEESKKRRFVYAVPSETSCLVELDEEPPHEVSKEAVEIALSVARGLGMEIFDELEPMRKEVVDGSDTSAFQRTIMIGMNGEIEVNGMRIAIPFASLEEESSGIIENNDEYALYDISRLGVPLIEVDTSPDIPSPAAAKDVALHIGTLLRLTGKVQRGIGSIRQDVNVSIRGGSRVEIKGLQEVGVISEYIENEVKRQLALVEIMAVLKSRKASVGNPKDVTAVFSGTASQLIKRSLSSGGRVIGMPLYKFEGIIGRELGEGRRLGTEISEYAKMAGVKGIIHGDEDLKGYGITEGELASLHKSLGIKKGDSFILIAAQEAQARKAAGLAASRAEMAMTVVPPETRAAINDDRHLTRFMRPLPGGSRMYPETDARPIQITKALLDKADLSKPQLEKEFSALKKQLGSEKLASEMIMSPRLQLYREILSSTKVEPSTLANVLLQKFTELKRNGYDADSIGTEKLAHVFGAYSSKRITKQAIEELLKRLSSGGEKNVDMLISDGLERFSREKVISIIKSEFKSERPEFLKKAIMSKYRLNIDGETLESVTSCL